MNHTLRTTWLAWLLAALMVLAVPGCRALSAGTGGAGGAGVVDRTLASVAPEQDRAPAGSAATVLRVGGALLTLAGLGLVAARFAGVFTAPLIGGILTAGTGVAALTLADLMSRHWWLGPLMLLGLVTLAVIEHLNDRHLLWRDPPEPSASSPPKESL